MLEEAAEQLLCTATNIGQGRFSTVVYIAVEHITPDQIRNEDIGEKIKNHEGKFF